MESSVADGTITRAALVARSAGYAVRALVLQGGGALGAYQGGVYEALAQADLHPDWVAGISIGALNAAIIAGNAPQDRVRQLRGFWETICRQPWWPGLNTIELDGLVDKWPDQLRAWADSLEALRALTEGQNGFYTPRPWPFLSRGNPQRASFYDTAPLRKTLLEFADFDRINRGPMRVSVGAVDVQSGNFTYFDSVRQPLVPEHFMASGALPPGFPAVEIDGQYYWDGGLVSNTPLFEVLTDVPRRNALIFQVDLWSATGAVPDTLLDVAERQKEVQYSSRTRMVTTYMKEQQEFRQMLNDVLGLVPAALRKDPAYVRAAAESCSARRNVIHLIYRNKPHEGHAKDYQFGALSMREHWASGLADMRGTLAHPAWFELPLPEAPFVTHDLHRLTR